MRIKIKFSEGQRFSVLFNDNEQKIPLNFGEFIVIHDYDWYDGEYVITPKIDEQLFITKNKTMKEDLVCNAIPYVEVSNPYGGYTVNIGG